MFRFFSVFILCFAIHLAFGENSRADEGFTFQTIRIKKGVPKDKEMALALKHYESRDYKKATLELFKIVDEDTLEAEKYKDKAQFLMGKCLYHLKLYQGALNYFDKIVTKGKNHQYYRATILWMFYIYQRLTGEPTILEKIAKYSPSDFPAKFRSELYYLQGLYFYKQHEITKAIQLLTLVSPKSRYYLEAKLIEGVAYVRENKPRESSTAFKQMLRTLLGKRAVSKPNQKYLHLAYLNLARVFYSVGQINLALKYYDKIPMESENGLDSIFEASWAYFRNKKYAKALGNLVTLNAPFFEEEYFPESLILKAVILFYNCQYPDTMLTLKDFRSLYPALKNNVLLYLKKYSMPIDFYAFLTKLARKDVAFSTNLKQIFNITLSDKGVQAFNAYIKELNTEILLLKEGKTEWESSKFVKSLIQETVMARSLARSEIGQLGQVRLQASAEQLEDLIQQTYRIEFEVASAQKELALSKLRDTQYQTGLKKGLSKSTDDEHIYWPFQGEYWKDELGQYYYSIQNRCGR